MKKIILRGLALCLSLLLSAGALALLSAAVTDQSAPDASLPEVYQQNDPRWGSKELIAPNGCGLLSLVNAVNYLTGSFIDPVELAVYAHKIDAYNGSVGGGTARWVLYHQLDKYEKKYGFDVVQTGKDAGVTHKDFIRHLKEGGVAVCHVYGHFIAIVDYNAKDRTYLVYDSAANPDRRNTTAAPTWLSEKYLTTSQYMTVDWWCLISPTESSENTVGGRTYTDRCVPASIRMGGDGKATLTGKVMTSRGVSSLCCVLDYDYDHIITLPDEFKADPDTRKSFSVDVSLEGLSQGQHTLRLIAKTPGSGQSDIAEYTLFIGDGSDGVDPATGDLVLGMSGFMGQDGIVAKLNTTGYDCPMFRADAGMVLFLGDVDLSQYRTVEVEYSTRSGFDVDKKGVTGLIGLKSQKSNYGSAGAEYDMSGSLVCTEMTEPAEGEGGFKQFRKAVLDVSELTYNSVLYLSTYTPYKDTIVIKSVRFCTGNEPVTEAPTEAPTEPATEAPTAADTEADTEADTSVPASDAVSDTSAPAESGTQPADGGCRSVVCEAAAVTLMALTAAALVSLRRRRED